MRKFRHFSLICLLQAALTYREDKCLHSGDNIMLKSCATGAVMVANPNEKMVSSDAYAVTASCSINAPCVRSCLRVEHAEPQADSQIRYGQDIRFCTHPGLHERELYLNSLPLTPMTFARYSRNQEVSVYYKKAYNTVWRVQPSSGKREEQQGACVKACDDVILEHVATSNYLSNDRINYQNEFGTELEVSCMAAATKHKTQILLNESQGTQVRENVHKNTACQNLWQFCMASCPEQAEMSATRRQISAQEILNIHQEHMQKDATLNFACMIHFLCKRNDMIGLDELVQALQMLDLQMTEQDYHKLFAHYQKNWNQPKIEWRQVAENLRVEMTDARQKCIREAYTKLDPQETSKVTIDDIAKNYCVDGARDVQNGMRTAEQHYNTFMGLWGCSSAEDQVTFDQFRAFFDNISSSYATDDEFCAMMKKCWSL